MSSSIPSLVFISPIAAFLSSSLICCNNSFILPSFPVLNSSVFAIYASTTLTASSNLFNLSWNSVLSVSVKLFSKAFASFNLSLHSVIYSFDFSKTTFNLSVELDKNAL